MAQLILGQVISMSADMADKLIQRGEGDAGLLFVALLRHSDVEKARKSLRWTAERMQRAWAVLSELGLVAKEENPASEQMPVEQEGPPDYLRADILVAMEEGTFQGLYQTVERRLGKKLSDTDLRSLYEIYDYLGLPVEVILILLTRCTEEFQEKYGPNRVPKMPFIKKTAYAWRRMGIDTAEAADEYLKQQTGLRTREKEILPILGIVGRFPLDREREYIKTWVEWGFSNEAIELAYEKTVLKKQSLNWSYMNSILKSWHTKGLHTLSAIQAGDSVRESKPREGVAAASRTQAFDDRLRRDMEWLKKFSEEKGGGE